MTDVFRKEYKPLSDEQKGKIVFVKKYAEDLFHQIDDIELVKDQRCREMAIVRLEEAVMWAIKAITA